MSQQKKFKGAFDSADFQSLFETHPSPMWVYDPKTLKFLIVNEAAVDLYGYPVDRYRSMTVLDIRPEYERQRMRDAVKHRSDVEKAERWIHQKADSTLFEVLTYGRAVHFDGREAILAIVQDRSELKVAQQEVNDTRLLLDTIVDNLPIGVFVKDMEDNGRFVLFNEACGKIVGRKPVDIIGRTDEVLFAGHKADQSRRAEIEATLTGNTVTFEEMIEDEHGDDRILRTSKRTLPAAKGAKSRYMMGISQDITQERATADELVRIAHYDGLTGLPNRAQFAAYLDGKCTLASELNPLALVYIDVDNFKNINDTKGHAAGDALLREVASRLSELAKPDHLVARLAGDEFAVVLYPSDEIRLDAFCATVLRAFTAPILVEGGTEHVTCSLGAALMPQHADGCDALLRNADFALYAAKASGRACFRFYEPEMRRVAEQRHHLTAQMRDALTHDPAQFEVFFQPIFQLDDDCLTGFEALVRWRHPDRGLIPPLEFIPLAEETGLIDQLGEWVLNESCRAAANWPSHLTVAVNVSVQQFRKSGLLAAVTGALDRSGIAPRRLEIEITESIFLRDAELFVPILQGLRQLGVHIAIDDFGTGYSSLSYLRSFEFDKIKLDRSFLAGLESDPGNLAIIRAVIGIGRGFHAVVVAEGVETEEQLELLRREGFGQAQGYLLGRPQPLSSLADSIRERRPNHFLSVPQ